MESSRLVLRSLIGQPNRAIGLGGGFHLPSSINILIQQLNADGLSGHGWNRVGRLLALDHSGRLQGQVLRRLPDPIFAW